MPICEADPWRLQYFEHAACPAGVNIPTEDSDAWIWYPNLPLRNVGRVEIRDSPVTGDISSDYLIRVQRDETDNVLRDPCRVQVADS